MYAANNDYAPAQALYARLLERSPTDVPLLLQTAAMATGAKDYAYAESLLSVALARAPRDPEVLTAAGRLYRAQGKNTKATEFFTAAVAAENAQRDAVLAASGVAAGPARAGNPFAQRAGLPQRVGGGLAVPGTASAAAVARSPVGYTPMQYAPQPAARSNAPAGLYIPDPAGASRFAQALPQPLQTPPMTPATYYPEAASPVVGAAAVPLPAASGKRSAGTASRAVPQPTGRVVPASPAPLPAAPVAPTAPVASAGFIAPAQASAASYGSQPVPASTAGQRAAAAEGADERLGRPARPAPFTREAERDLVRLVRMRAGHERPQQDVLRGQPHQAAVVDPGLRQHLDLAGLERQFQRLVDEREPAGAERAAGPGIVGDEDAAAAPGLARHDRLRLLDLGQQTLHLPHVVDGEATDVERRRL